MAKFVPDLDLGLVLDEIEKSDEEVVLSQQPTTYFNCVRPNVWVGSSFVSIGDLRRPPTNNGFIYECLVGGTTGGIEPGWSTVQDGEFSDNDITWKAHENYALANSPLTPGDKVRADGDVDGLKLTIAEIPGVATHTTGTVTNTALIEHATRKLRLVTDTSTTVVGNNDIESGRTTIFHEFSINARDPQ